MNNYIDIIINLAKKAMKKDEIPVGCIIVKNNKIIAKSYNTRQKSHKIIDHAEIKCIIKTAKKLKDWRLDGCVMYVTLKPCKMCEEIIKESRINKVYYLLNSTYNESQKVNIYEKIECKKENYYKSLLNEYFALKR